ncbi:MAG: outer membrane protein assembly factor BamB family protein, partial [Candidatus Xenobia bacterium]
ATKKAAAPAPLRPRGERPAATGGSLRRREAAPAAVIEEAAAPAFDTERRLGAELAESAVDYALRPWLRLPPRELWSFAPEAAVLPTFAVGPDMVFQATVDGQLHALLIDTGEVLWERKAPNGLWRHLHAWEDGVVGQMWAAPGVSGRAQFLGLQSYDCDGNVLWTCGAELSGGQAETARAAATEDALILLFQSFSQEQYVLCSLDLRSGKVRWSRRFDTLTTWVAPCGDSVCLWNQQEGVLQVDLANGETRWVHETLRAWDGDRHAPAIPWEMEDQVLHLVFLRGSSPEGLRQIVCVASDDGRIGWRRHLAPPIGNARGVGPQRITVAGPHMLCTIHWQYRGTGRNSLFCLDPATGLPVWSYDVRGYLDAVHEFHDGVLLATTPVRGDRRWGPFSTATTGNLVRHGEGDPMPGQSLRRFGLSTTPFRALDAASGRELWRFSPSHREAVSFLIEPYEEYVIAAGSDGRLRCLGWPHS